MHGQGIHTHTAQPCQGHRAKARHAAHAQEKLQGRGVFTGCLLTSQQGKNPKNQHYGERSKGCNESWVPDPLKSRLIRRELSTEHFQEEKCCQIVFTAQICQTGKTRWIKCNWSRFILSHCFQDCPDLLFVHLSITVAAAAPPVMAAQDPLELCAFQHRVP